MKLTQSQMSCRAFLPLKNSFVFRAPRETHPGGVGVWGESHIAAGVSGIPRVHDQAKFRTNTMSCQPQSFRKAFWHCARPHRSGLFSLLPEGMIAIPSPGKD